MEFVTESVPVDGVVVVPELLAHADSTSTTKTSDTRLRMQSLSHRRQVTAKDSDIGVGLPD